MEEKYLVWHIEGGLGKAGSGLTKAAEWVGTKFKGLIGEEMATLLRQGASKVKGWLAGFVESIMKWFGKGGTATAEKAVLGQVEKKAAKRFTPFSISKVQLNP